MILSKGVLIKGGASIAVAGLAVGGYVGKNRIGEFFRGTSILDKAGIKCDDQNGCVLGKDKKITIRQESTSKEVSSLSSVTSTRAKIILHRLNENDYNEGLKFTVEEGDIILKKASPSIVMERSETYELKEEDGKFILSRKSKSTMRRWGDLKIPKGCPESAGSATVECTIGLPSAENISFKSKRQFPPTPYIEEIMKELKLTLPKDLENLGVGTPKTKTFWKLPPKGSKDN